eukprot:3009339-Pyramimonas_sp.AAC.2
MSFRMLRQLSAMRCAARGNVCCVKGRNLLTNVSNSIRVLNYNDITARASSALFVSNVRTMPVLLSEIPKGRKNDSVRRRVKG